MKEVGALLLSASLISGVGSQTLTVKTIVESLAVRYDRVHSYYADADVFEYSS